MELAPLEAVPVLADCVLRDSVDLRPAIVATVRQRTELSTLLREVNAAFAKRNKSLKRVKALPDARFALLITDDVHGHDEGSIRALLSSRGVDCAAAFEAGFETAYVASAEARTRRQFDAARDAWPCSFHEDKRLEALLARGLPELWSAGRRSAQNRFLSLAEALRRPCSDGGAEAKCAAVVVDADDRVVAAAAERTNEHPLRHAAMEVVDIVAGSQGGGWTRRPPPKSESQGERTDSTKGTCAVGASSAADAAASAVSSPPPLKNAAACAAAAAAASAAAADHYLCTGMDVYLTHEPCLMCAMALVHARIRRVFYRYSSPNVGALGSKFKLHLLPGINHNYEVFTFQPKENDCSSYPTAD